ncbi:hypothetical protein N0V82_009766 [Gnomoniopsis sp. IMI 355080]|nr:hypothetical protein N0V82_009766 [Gnomoniopsis sp. IMI 355080]
MVAKATTIQNGHWPEIPDGESKVDEELRDWIIAETKITDAEEGRRDVWATTARDPIDYAVHSNGDTQTWVRNTHDTAQNDLSSVCSPYSRPSTSHNPLFERHKGGRKGLPVEFPGQHRELDLVPGSVFLVDSKGSFLKLPIPSNMPEDPLRWGYWKKTGAIACLLFYSMLSISSCQLPEINFQLLLRDPTMQQLVVFPPLFIGLGSFIWAPLSIAIGRRPVLLFGTALQAVGCIIAATAKDFNALLAAVCVKGLASATAWSLALLIIIDLTFIHERPQVLATYWCLGGIFNLVALTIAPRVTETVLGNNWHSIEWIWVVLSVLSLVASLLFLPETYFVRPAVAYDGKILIQSAGEKVHIYEDGQVRRPDEYKPTTKGSNANRWGARVSWADAGACYPQILLHLLNPLVFWLTLLNTLSFVATIVLASQYPALLTSPPYSQPPSIVGLVNLAGAGGVLLAWPSCGLLISKCIQRSSRRNDGLRHAEHYLPAFILPIIAGVSGLLIFGIGFEHRPSSPFFVYVAYAFTTFSFGGLSVASTLWVTEAFPQWATSALVVVGGSSYLLSFGVTLSLPQLIALHGFEALSIALAVSIMVLGVVAVPIAFWGKEVRQYVHGRWAQYEGGALRPQR